jgi:hypothetical protein
MVIVFIPDSYFPRQQIGKKMFLSKMFVHGDGNGCDLVKWMQPGGDLLTTWIMFDHIKHVKGWTTFTHHVYDSFYYKVMIIAICDM